MLTSSYHVDLRPNDAPVRQARRSAGGPAGSRSPPCRPGRRRAGSRAGQLARSRSRRSRLGSCPAGARLARAWILSRARSASVSVIHRAMLAGSAPASRAARYWASFRSHVGQLMLMLRVGRGRAGPRRDGCGGDQLVDGGGQVAGLELAGQPFVERPEQRVLAECHVPRMAPACWPGRTRPGTGTGSTARWLAQWPCIFRPHTPQYEQPAQDVVVLGAVRPVHGPGCVRARPGPRPPARNVSSSMIGGCDDRVRPDPLAPGRSTASWSCGRARRRGRRSAPRRCAAGSRPGGRCSAGW